MHFKLLNLFWNYISEIHAFYSVTLPRGPYSQISWSFYNYWSVSGKAGFRATHLPMHVCVEPLLIAQGREATEPFRVVNFMLTRLSSFSLILHASSPSLLFLTANTDILALTLFRAKAEWHEINSCLRFLNTLSLSPLFSVCPISIP